MKEKMKYMEPEMGIAMLTGENVITTSETLNNNGGTTGGNGEGGFIDDIFGL